MAYYAFLNEILQGQLERTLKHRVDVAKQAGGENFWDTFFGCEDQEHHKKENQRFVYIFTKQQLCYLLKLWEDLVKVFNEDSTVTESSDSLLVQWHVFFSTYKNKGRIAVKKPAYCIECTGPGRKRFRPDFKLKPLSFILGTLDIPPSTEEEINFFSGKITEDKHDPGSPENENDWCEYMGNLLAKLRGQIPSDFGLFQVRGNWLFYNGHVYRPGGPKKVYFHEKIIYCKDKHSQCRFVISDR